MQGSQHLRSLLGFPGALVVKNLLANAGDMGSIPGSGRSAGVGNGDSPPYSCLAGYNGVAKHWM